MANGKSEGTDPVVFKMPTLGHAVRLGELYDQRSGQFLGVQLYPEENVEAAETDIKHTELSLSLSTTLEDKASLLDINAKLSLEILGGMISVSGSASYVKDTKSNTNEQAFALVLKMRLKEKRILFAEDKLGRNILNVASEDYITGNLATHFVSAIVYGGNLVVNLVARQSKLDTEEKLEGQLQAKFDKLKGAISLEGEVKADIKDKFNSMNDKFDLVMHGDIALDRVPVNPKDVLEIIPEGAKLITVDGGVPISVTLQPIPEELITGTKVHEIDALLVDQILKAFSHLDDLRSRFAVLVDGAKSFEEFVPELARVARVVANRYAEEHGSLLHGLRQFLSDYQHGKKEDSDMDPKVLQNARELHNRHLELEYAGHKPSDYYPSTLAGLENELLKFRYFVSDIQASRDSVMSLAEASKKFVCLSSFDTVSRFIRLQSKVPLFVMPPFTPMQPGETKPDPSASPDIFIIQFLAILRENARYFNSSSAPAHILYAETLETLERRLPNLARKFPKKPSLLIGEVNAKGLLSWSDPPLTTELYLKLHTQSSGGKLGEMACNVDAVNGRRSFSLQVRAKSSGSASANNSIICSLQTQNEIAYLLFQTQPLGVAIKRNFDKVEIKSDLAKSPKPGQSFIATFVQDVESEKWFIYLEGEEIVSKKFDKDVLELLSDAINMQLVYSVPNPIKRNAKDIPEDVQWWNGEVDEVRVFSVALDKKQVENEAKNV